MRRKLFVILTVACTALALVGGVATFGNPEYYDDRQAAAIAVRCFVSSFGWPEDAEALASSLEFPGEGKQWVPRTELVEVTVTAEGSCVSLRSLARGDLFEKVVLSATRKVLTPASAARGTYYLVLTERSRSGRVFVGARFSFRDA